MFTAHEEYDPLSHRVNEAGKAMQNKFLSTTAMVATTMLLASTGAHGADKIKLGLGGYFHAYAGVGSQDDGAGEPGAGLRNHKIVRESEIHFLGKTTLDNGITFGVNVQLEGETCTDQIDESYIYIEGNFGRVSIGADDPASDLMAYSAPQPISGVGILSPDVTFITIGNAVGTPDAATSISGDSEKITYFTPRLSGFQLGLSYTPDSCEEGACGGTYAGFQSDATAAQQSEIIEIGANYSRKIGGVNIAWSGGYGRGDLEVAAAGSEDQTQWSLGMELGFGPLTFGAAYRNDDQGTSGSNTDRTDYGMGVTYAMGDWTFGAAFAHGEAEAGAGLGQDETDGYQIGATYNMGPGIALTGGVTHWEVDDNLNAVAIENTGTALVFGTILSF